MDDPWLDDDQQRAWRALVGVVLKLPGLLEAQLQRDAGMTHFEYWVCALLSEATDRRLPLKALAGQASCSLSRLSHVVTRLEGRGWVRRAPSPDDARVTYAVLTDAGMVQVEEAAPGHAATVRDLVFGDLAAADVADLERVCGQVLARLDA